MIFREESFKLLDTCHVNLAEAQAFKARAGFNSSALYSCLQGRWKIEVHSDASRSLLWVKETNMIPPGHLGLRPLVFLWEMNLSQRSTVAPAKNGGIFIRAGLKCQLPGAPFCERSPVTLHRGLEIALDV